MIRCLCVVLHNILWFLQAYMLSLFKIKDCRPSASFSVVLFLKVGNRAVIRPLITVILAAPHCCISCLIPSDGKHSRTVVTTAHIRQMNQNTGENRSIANVIVKVYSKGEAIPKSGK